ncbi:MAG: FAD-binding protein [Ignavibacteria bacterium]|nr:FAD-binding protein [Ignavibacteria bacterium]
MISIEHIRSICSGRIAISEPLARMTTFRLGGPADIYVEPATTAELIALVRTFRDGDLPFLVLGNGSNVLVSDDGFRGAAINLEHGFARATVDDDVVDAGAGVRLSSSGLKGDIVLSARFTPPRGDIESMKRRRKDLLLKRNASQPTAFPNAGSIFKNPEGGYAAMLIQECGLKGFRIGGAEVSELHANFIIGRDNATAADILAVINHVRGVVFSRRGVVLEPEILLMGFPDNALLPISSDSEGVVA